MGTGFPKRSCSNKKIERDDDSKKSHLALADTQVSRVHERHRVIRLQASSPAIFGAAKQNLKIIETRIRYKARTFGETQISRFRDGWLLLKMVWFAYRKLKAI